MIWEKSFGSNNGLMRGGGESFECSTSSTRGITLNFSELIIKTIREAKKSIEDFIFIFGINKSCASLSIINKVTELPYEIQNKYNKKFIFLVDLLSFYAGIFRDRTLGDKF